MENFFAGINYLKYCLRANNAHGVHSPFVYDLLNNIILDNTPFYVFDIIESIRAKNLLNNSQINIEDFGTGKKQRKVLVSDIAKKVVKSKKYAQLLFRLVNRFSSENILEIGTYTGYSAICLYEGLQPHGKLITIDINEELKEMAENYFKRAGIKSKVTHFTGNALEIIPNLKLNFDLVFIDADKVNYSRYFDLAFPKLNTGGYILADNVLWSGNVLKPADEQDDETKAIVSFNKKVMQDERVETVLLPVRDGIMLIRKK